MDSHAAGRRAIRTPSPPESRRDDSPGEEASVTDNSTFPQDDFSFKKVIRSIAALSGAQAGPPAGVRDTRDLPLTMRSQIAVPPPESFIALETTQAVRNGMLKRQLLFQEEDTKQKSGPTLARLHMTAPRMIVKGNSTLHLTR